MKGAIIPNIPFYQPLVFASAEFAATEIRANFARLRRNWTECSAGSGYSPDFSSLSATSLCSGHTRGATDTMTMAFRGLIFNALYK